MEESKTIEQLNLFVERVREMGIEVRHELLGGTGAGLCELHGHPLLFLDMSCGPEEQLEAIRNALPALNDVSENVNS